jgi:hypothetical protein
MDISGPDRQSLVYAFSPNLLDEFRFGFTVEKDGMRNQIKGRGPTPRCRPPSSFVSCALQHVQSCC